MVRKVFFFFPFELGKFLFFLIWHENDYYFVGYEKKKKKKGGGGGIMQKCKNGLKKNKNKKFRQQYLNNYLTSPIHTIERRVGRFS